MRKLLTLAVVALVAIPLSAATKQETHNQLVQLGNQIEVQRAQGQDISSLVDQYRSLSSSLGFDDPAGVLGNRGGTNGGSNVAPPPPPGGMGTTTNFANNTPAAINDNATTSVTVNVNGVGTYLADVDLITDITHTFASDLDMTLMSPSGTVITISTDNGGSNDDVYVGTVFDDQATNIVTDFVYTNGVPTGPLVPEAAHGAFIGEDPNGIWTFEIFDDAGGDTGTLNSWSLDITTLDAAPVATGPINFANGTPAPISDNTTTTTTVDATGVGAYLCDVDLTVDITHTFASDLEMSLTSPLGTVVTISTDNGGSNDDVFVGTVFDDSALEPATDFTYTNATPTGPLVPEGALSGLIGEDPNGTWTFEVFDDAGGDTGTLNSWSIDVTTCVGVPPAVPIIEVPTVDGVGLAVLALLLMLGGAWTLTRRISNSRSSEPRS